MWQWIRWSVHPPPTHFCLQAATFEPWVSRVSPPWGQFSWITAISCTSALLVLLSMKPWTARNLNRSVKNWWNCSVSSKPNGSSTDGESLFFFFFAAAALWKLIRHSLNVMWKELMLRVAIQRGGSCGNMSQVNSERFEMNKWWKGKCVSGSLVTGSRRTWSHDVSRSPSSSVSTQTL